ncbi:plasmodesmata-located protein 2-like [Diospyros lotus]|uniref:plasmodesmata-located protein 2-like n=1 Tax=Diospyros lotus TaxID=55363 RepID=UPI0022598F34|nr:plasmodesmata-located protein 2-like [Diospyros lotus]
MAKACCLLSLAAFCLFSRYCYAQSNSSSYVNYPSSALVFRRCPDHGAFTDHQEGSLPEILSSLFQELANHSSQSRFYETTVGDENIAVYGLFQCRHDLSGDDCRRCVNQLPQLSNSFCGARVPARVHLSGCYIRYQADGIETSRVELQHKICGDTKEVSGGGFEELRDGALAAAESCVVTENGHCEMEYHGRMRVVAQCEGQLGRCDCAECIGSAAQIAQDECGSSLSGKIYLQSCFLSYGYYQNRDPTTGLFPEYRKAKGAPTKLVAIIVGGAALLFIVFGLFYSLRACRKTSDEW